MPSFMLLPSPPVAMQMNRFDAHEKPPGSLRAVYKKFQKLSVNALAHTPEIVDFVHGRSLLGKQGIRIAHTFKFPVPEAQSSGFLSPDFTDLHSFQTVKVFGHHAFPGACTMSVLGAPCSDS